MLLRRVLRRRLVSVSVGTGALRSQERLVGMSQRVFNHREKFRGFEASGPNLRFSFALVSKRSVH